MKTCLTIRMRTCSTYDANRWEACMAPGILILATLWLFTAHAIAQDWTPTGAPTNFWNCIATSADGTKLIAAAASEVGPIYASTNSGTNWSATSAPIGLWNALACSADGARLVAAGSDYLYVTNGFDIYTFATNARIYFSTNTGVTWTKGSGIPADVITLGSWTGAAASADGSKMAAVTTKKIYTSTNAGGTWSLRNAPQKQWNSIASSADGTRLVAVAVKGGIFRSVDSGVTWLSTDAPSDLWWWDVASSADGGRLVAASLYNGQATADGSIYVSSNAGTNWVQTSAPSNRWVSVAASADATTLVAATSSNSPAGIFGVIFLSRDSGVTWMATDPSRAGTSWESVATSADGNRLFAVLNLGGIHTLQTPATPRLDIAATGTNCILSWIIPSMEFGLQESLDLNLTNWTDVSTQPTVVNYQKQLILTPQSGNHFYRLKSY